MTFMPIPKNFKSASLKFTERNEFLVIFSKLSVAVLEMLWGHSGSEQAWTFGNNLKIVFDKFINWAKI